MLHVKSEFAHNSNPPPEEEKERAREREIVILFIIYSFMFHNGTQAIEFTIDS